MRKPISIKSSMENLASHGGLINIGALIEATQLRERLDRLTNVRCTEPDFSHSEIIFSMLGLISIGKPDYDAIEIFRSKPDFFTKAMGISGVPSSPTIRQRLDLIGQAAEKDLKEESAALVKSTAPSITPLDTSAGKFIPLDIDVSPFDNSKTKKEGVSRTCKGCDGYAPIFAYLGTEGYLVNLELREGSQHCQKGTPEFIDGTLRYVRQITDQPVLMRLDSGNDSRDNFPDQTFGNVQFIIKRNLRRESLDDWAELAKKTGTRQPGCRPGKSVWTGRTNVGIKGQRLPFPIVFEVTERTVKKGQQLLFPEYQVDTYWCSIEKLDADEVIGLYHDHGTSEQFHAELKSDMGLERLPSGRFSTNSLFLHLAMLAYNMLRIIGQLSVEQMDGTPLPVNRQKKVTRRRIRTVMQDLIYMAGRLIHTGRRWFVSFGQMNPFAQLAEKIYCRLCGSPS